MSDMPISECQCCGTCCKKGGPSFHHEDRRLIEQGSIPLKYLYTIRKGELARDNVRDRLLPVDSDIIKIRGRNASWTCAFLDEQTCRCTIYEDRPIECRVLKCWDTRDIERIYAQNRLTREDLLSGVAGLWEVIEEHASLCDYEKIGQLAALLDGDGRETALEGIRVAFAYDASLRSLSVQEGRVRADMTDFLFGRPLTETIRMFGLKVAESQDRFILSKI